MYRRRIAETLDNLGRRGYDPRHVEAWMRLECNTLDWLSRERFEREVAIACDCIDADPKGSESLAVSYGY